MSENLKENIKGAAYVVAGVAIIAAKVYITSALLRKIF